MRLPPPPAVQVKGPAQNAVKQRALRCLKQKRLYESQRDQLYSQQYNIDQISFTSESIQDSITTVKALKAQQRPVLSVGLLRTRVLP